MHCWSYYLVVFVRQFCSAGSLDPMKAKGKIIYCTRSNSSPDEEASWVVAQVGGVGMILANPLKTNDKITPRAHFVPTSVIYADDGLSILSYINSTK